jgi:hypothetical protein
MKRLQLLTAILASLCAASAFAAQPNQTHFILQSVEGSPLQAGDALVANGAGEVALFRGNQFVATLHDPQDLVGTRASGPIYVTDAEGSIVRGNVASFKGDMFVSADAPEIVYYKKEFIDSKAHTAKPRGGGGSVDMTAHGGTVLTSNHTTAIFWGTSWPGSTSDIVAGIDSFFSGWGGSHMAGDSTEYSGTNGQVTSSSTYDGHVFDSTAAPSKALSVSNAVAEACKMTGNNPRSDALYLIYTDTGAGHVSYCAWHSWGTCSNGAQVQVAYMPNITGLAGCDPGSYAGHSEGLAALANVTSHELSEAITDPRGAGWFDSTGAENGDKCAWAFNGNETLKNGSSWYLQGEWSNQAYDSGTGLPNRSGQKGCLY